MSVFDGFASGATDRLGASLGSGRDDAGTAGVAPTRGAQGASGSGGVGSSYGAQGASGSGDGASSRSARGVSGFANGASVFSGGPNDGRALQRLLDELGRLPGIGPKSAQRIAYFLLESDAEQGRRLANAILDVKRQVHFCPVCFSYATRDTCDVCADSTRDVTTICVVSEPRDVAAVERTGSYHGLYHVLGGVISPMDRIGPDQLHVRELLARLASGEVQEIILATNTDVEGEATATYLSRTIKPMGVKVTRFAVGMSVGGEVELADELSLGRAIEDRREV